MGMQPSYKCAACGIDTVIDPETRPKWADEAQKIPQMGKIIKQCHRTGKVFQIDVPLLEDKTPRTIPISLRIGHETVNASFCRSCAEELRPQYEALLEKLISFLGRKEGA